MNSSRPTKKQVIGPQHGHDVRDELAVAHPVGAHRQRSEQRVQQHPEQQATVETAPEGGDLVEQRHGRVAGVLHVLDRIVT
jgi:hypothetical protein